MVVERDGFSPRLGTDVGVGWGRMSCRQPEENLAMLIASIRTTMKMSNGALCGGSRWASPIRNQSQPVRRRLLCINGVPSVPAPALACFPG
jgi:hypothetical protein